MKPQETKFEFVYNEIKQCILDGQIPHGNALPSSRMYCEQFHVSRYTINRVFEALRAEGLVDIQPRLAPIVVSKKDTCSSSNIVLEILKQKESIRNRFVRRGRSRRGITAAFSFSTTFFEPQSGRKRGLYGFL